MTKAQTLPAAGTKAVPPSGTTSGKVKKPLKPPMLYFGFVALIGFLSIPGAVLAIGGTLPAISCWLSDRLPGKPFGLCIGFMNMGAVVFFLLRVVPYGHDFEKAMEIVGDGTTWFAIYMVAFLGWGIFFGVPVMIQRRLSGQIHTRAEKARTRQQELITAWGKDVAAAGASRPLPD
jgi:hypothetical protein